VEELLTEIDLVLLDVKQFNPERHRQLTGRSNEQTLRTAAWLEEHDHPFWLRYVLVPGYSDMEEDIRALGEALLDQRNLAGIGNVFKSEICFLLRVTPWLPVGALPTEYAAHLPTVSKKLLDYNRERPTRVTTGRSDQTLFVYGRAGRPCLRCGTRIRVAEQGDGSRERPTYWCPSCQPGPYPQPGTSQRPSRTPASRKNN
jgi:hypothetical protein